MTVVFLMYFKTNAVP